MQGDSSLTNSTTIAVVIPAYNAEKYLLQTLESVWGQTRLPDEILVVNDGSTDRTYELLEKVGHRLRILHTPNRGLAAARNAGVSLAQSRYIAFLDADDYWPANKLKVYESLAQQHPEVGLFYSDSVYVGPSGFLRSVHALDPGSNPFLKLLKYNFIASSSVMIDRGIFEQVGGLRGGYSHPAGVVDWDFFLKVAQVKRIHRIPEPLLYYRVHNQSAMRTRTLALWKDSLRVVFRHSRGVPIEIKREALASVFYQSGLRLLTTGDLPMARNHFCSSFAYFYRPLSCGIGIVCALAGPRVVNFLLTIRRFFLKRMALNSLVSHRMDV